MPRPGTLFDAYVAVDWSASKVPKLGADSVWIGRAQRQGARVASAVPSNPPTRSAATSALRDALAADVAAARRVLVAWDFPFGYPAGFAHAAALPGDGAPWRRAWEWLAARVRDDDGNGNNRFAVAAELNARLSGAPDRGPFWGRPGAVVGVPAKRPGFPFATTGRAMPEHRLAEARLRAAGKRPQPVWKLYTTGSVGSQALLGIPRVLALREDPGLAAVSRIWPFETGFTAEPTGERGPAIVHAEAWPSAFPLDLPAGVVKDAAQVRGLAQLLARLDARRALAPHLDLPPGLAAADARAAVAEEAWVLGA